MLLGGVWACVRACVFGWFIGCLACLSRDGTQRDMQFLLVDKVDWIPIIIVKKKKKKLQPCVQIALKFKERSSFLIWGAPPRVFNRFLDFQGSGSVNYPRVKSRVGIKMWAQCQMHSYRLKCHNTWLPSRSCVPASSGGIDGTNQIEKEESLLLVSAHGTNSDFFSSHTLLYSINFAEAPHKTSPLVSLVPFFLLTSVHRFI